MKANLITREGWTALDEELKYLWKVKRPQVTIAVREAAALGDRSENAEYKEGKRELRSIDRRVRFLVKRLDCLRIVEYDPQQEGKVYFGAWVELEKDDGTLFRGRIVGTDEYDPKKNWISIDSPMARALLGKQIDDEVFVQTPSGRQTWYIITIQYQPFTEPGNHE